MKSGDGMSEYEEVENPREIRRLNRLLSEKLRQQLRYSETRTIGYPQGSFRDRVHFRQRRGEGIFWWSGRISEDDNRIALNFFGHGAPSGNASLNIDVQFNLPVEDFSRSRGGSFLRHVPTNTVVLAHRGIVTLGHARIRKSALFADMVATLREADTSNGVAEFLIIGDLDSRTLVDDIDTFAIELRRVVKSIKSDSEIRRQQRTAHAESRRKPSAPRLGALRRYFDEFSGKRKFKIASKGVADCYHGTVVRKLRDSFLDAVEFLKSREIDLIVRTRKKVLIFEVKTSTHPQYVYTAIGQITVHTPSIRQFIPDVAIERVIVLPGKPAAHLYDILSNQLGIRVLTFDRSTQGRITINGLSGLVR
jgi:hypothetical protein